MNISFIHLHTYIIIERQKSLNEFEALVKTTKADWKRWDFCSRLNVDTCVQVES